MNNTSQRTIHTDFRTETIRNLVQNHNPQNGADLEFDCKWQLYTLFGTCISWLGFFIIILLFAEKYSNIAYTLLPLILYDIIKITMCGIYLYKEWEIEGKDYLKDIIESVFMILYKIGIIIKILNPDVDCTYLIAPITLIIITRIVLAMGILKEINGIYQAVFLS